MDVQPIIIIGAGIGGLVTALSLHAAGIPCDIYESVDEIRPLGVGINLLPHATLRSSMPLASSTNYCPSPSNPPPCATLPAVVNKSGASRVGEPPRYQWPQLSIHRGLLQTTLLNITKARIGADHIHTGYHLTALTSNAHGATAHFSAGRRGDHRATIHGTMIIAADGIHSVARALHYPHELPPRWNGALLWRGTAEAPPLFDGRTMVWAGHPDHKFVGYPIRDLPNGKQLFNFIAEFRTSNMLLAEREDWNQPGVLSDFIDRFTDWCFDWLDVPALIQSAPGTYRFPMVDRDPLPQWSTVPPCSVTPPTPCTPSGPTAPRRPSSMPACS
jgi:2-polyprenyl-6-methoxyphenol hydroxylase-like FAD-dependent oxidoreductase